MKGHEQDPPDTRGASPHPQRTVKPGDEAVGDRSYGDRASATDPSPPRSRPADGDDLREGYDATADAASTLRRTRGPEQERSGER
ncbi:hypothetical protein [Kitasatospora sp. NPDC093679]|uniref:hypothetical protein n=1 Tax=unclassified Kitasatospora TaxID=2633591 RepID=UPI00343EDF39